MDDRALEQAIILAALKYHANKTAETPEVQLANEYPVDVVRQKMEQMVKEGYLERAAIARTAWPTALGLSLLKD